MKKKLEAVEAFVSTFQDQVSEAIREKASDLPTVRLFCQDESRFGLLPVIRRRISLPGIKPIAKVEEKYESVYLYGAVDPRTGSSFFLEFSDLTADCFQLFLDQFSEAFPESLNLLVLDNGRFHHAKSLEIPENIVLLFLPAYSPELNPMERFWQDLKAKVFLQTYETLEAMQTQITKSLRAYSNAAIAKLTGFSYFIKVANAI